ncbi:MAG: YcjX family protein, partial [Deltaproteobacteria bacterium]|nr:YcjX family protein [Deltaproteobacteria bacterium]
KEEYMRIKENLLGTACNRIMGRRSPLRIAIVGSQASGKTVFLTSLIDHLQHHDPQALKLGSGVEILKCETLKNSSGFAPFPFEYNRSTLVHNNAWPEKTTDVSEIRLKLDLKRGNKKIEQVCLEFLDFPGEGAADFLMFSRTYSEWSDVVLGSIQADCCYSELARNFNTVVASSFDERGLFYAYKMFLGEALVQRYSRIITPSVYLIDSAGKRPAGNGTPESWSQERFCGLSASEQFVPLPESVRLQNNSLVKKFEARYRKYRNRIVNPLVDWLEDADQMYILLDIVQILMGGYSMYNDEQIIAERVLEICDNNRSFWQDLLQVGVLG